MASKYCVNPYYRLDKERLLIFKTRFIPASRVCWLIRLFSISLAKNTKYTVTQRIEPTREIMGLQTIVTIWWRWIVLILREFCSLECGHKSPDPASNFPEHFVVYFDSCMHACFATPAMPSVPDHAKITE